MQIRKLDIDKAQHKIYNPPSIKKKKKKKISVSSLCCSGTMCPFGLFGDYQTLGSSIYWVELDTHISEKIQ